MRTRTVYTVTKHTPIYGVYTCSNCGEKVLFVNHVSHSESEAISGLYHSKFTKAEVYYDLEKRAQQPLSQKAKNIIGQSNKRNFKIHEFNCNCQNCGNTEIWANLKYSKREDLIITLSLILLFICVLLLVDGKMFLISFLGILLAVASISGWYIFKNRDIKKKEKALETLSDSNFPVLFVSEKSCIDYIKRNNYVIKGFNDIDTIIKEANRALEEKMYLESEMCRNCGAVLKPNQTVCHVCGETFSE